jgi:hypothetical protein
MAFVRAIKIDKGLHQVGVLIIQDKADSHEFVQALKQFNFNHKSIAKHRLGYNAKVSTSIDAGYVACEKGEYWIIALVGKDKDRMRGLIEDYMVLLPMVFAKSYGKLELENGTRKIFAAETMAAFDQYKSVESRLVREVATVSLCMILVVAAGYYAWKYFS